MPKSRVAISPDDRGFLFADGVYEVIRSHQGRLFRQEDHLRRLAFGLAELRIASVDTARLGTVAEQLIERNGLREGDAAVYIQVTRGVAPRRHAFPDPPVPPTIYACAWPVRQARRNQRKGINVILVPDRRWTRCDIKSVALLPNVLAHQEARERGGQEAVFVRDGNITEGSLCSVCAVFGGRLYTSPLISGILPGITRATVLELCRERGIAVRETSISRRRFERADEIMTLSTTQDITPVTRVNGRPVGDGAPGPVTRALQRALRQRLRR
jgi:D-alanine transaminase